jgi:hypothetical protein
MMSMKTNAGLTFMDIAPMLKINELEDICLGQQVDNLWSIKTRLLGMSKEHAQVPGTS